MPRLFLYWAIICLIASDLYSKTLYVSLHGDIGWSGSLPDPNPTHTDGPLPTVFAARDKLRSLRKAGDHSPAQIVIRAGTYHLGQPLVLTAQDSDVTYSAFPGELPTLSGGLPVSGWQRAAGSIWTATAQGHFRQLFVNGRRAQRSRRPHEGFYRFAGFASAGTPDVFHYRGEDIQPAWASADIELAAIFTWKEIKTKIAVDPTTRTVKFLNTGRLIPPEEIDARYWLENVPGPIEKPGEWFHDEKSGLLTYWPKEKFASDLSKQETVVGSLRSIVQTRGDTNRGQFVQNISFKGLRFSYTDWDLPPAWIVGARAEDAPSAFEIYGAKKLTISRCTFSHLAGYAVDIGRGSSYVQVLNSEIYDMGAGGVRIGDLQISPFSLDYVGNNVVSDNEIHDLGLVFPSAVGIEIRQSGYNLIAHNHIHHTYYGGISVGLQMNYDANPCNHNIIEFNSIHDVGRDEMSDLGGIYTLGDQPGTIIRNNVIHDVSAGGFLGAAIYLDAASSNIDVSNNIVYHNRDGIFYQNNARQNKIHNNIVAWNTEFQLMHDPPVSGTSLDLQHNIIIFEQGELFDANDNRWRDVTIDNNLYWNPSSPILRFGEKTHDEWLKSGFDAHSLIADPKFVNPQMSDFRLLPNSPAKTIGFSEIDVSTVGPRTTASK